MTFSQNEKNKISLYENVSAIKGIGKKKCGLLETLGIITVEDLLNHFPFRYEDRRNITPSDRTDEKRPYLVRGILRRKSMRHISRGRSMTEFSFSDPGGGFAVVFFNMPYVMKNFEIGRAYVMYGRVERRNGLKVMTNPSFSEEGGKNDIRGIIPVYRCTAGITSRELRKWVGYAIDNGDIEEWLDPHITEERRLCSEAYAYHHIHFPRDGKSYGAAKYRLIYDSLLIYSIAVCRNRLLIRSGNCDTSIDDCSIKQFIDDLPFDLTEGQMQAVKEIEADLISKKPMNRLIQGDVGCGKTVVAECAIFKTVSAGFQCAFMAPTELLARQHYDELSRRFEPYGFSIALLVSGLKHSERSEILEGLRNGNIDIAVGTHALIQDDVQFRKLGLAVTDEQHRFGVGQRRALTEKAGAVNVMVMSATPIPRTLAATVFGDMDFSVIRTLPGGRKKIITQALDGASSGRAFAAAEQEMRKGNQVYLVAPSIDEDDDEKTLESAKGLYSKMKKKFPDFRIGLVHGKLTKDEKSSVMDSFADKKLDMLVSTVVIEVGIDVPDATVMIIENAERFGLAQLHQLRGRVGRSSKQSYCYLINHGDSESARTRMNIMVSTDDGFEIAEEDFKMRGPGDIAGTAQSGSYGGIFTEIYKYPEAFSDACEDAERILKNTDDQTDKDHIDRMLRRFYRVDYSDVI